MPKAKQKKKSEVAATMTKSVFLHGCPNEEKNICLKTIQEAYTSAVNTYINLLNKESSLVFQILMNRKKDPDIRIYEKTHRIKELGSAYSQNAFDDAVTMLHNRLIDIKSEAYRHTHSILASVATLFCCVITQKPKEDMVLMLTKIRDSYKEDSKIEQYQKLLDQLNGMSDSDFEAQYNDVLFNVKLAEDMFKIPYVKNPYVKLDNRVSALEPATTAKCDFVLRVTVPRNLMPAKSKPKRIEIPLYTSEDSIRRLNQYKVSSGMTFTINPDRKLKVTVPFSKKPNLLDESDLSEIIGVDVGITDAFHLSNGEAIGSFSPTIKFYKDEVEPLLGQISCMRNKKSQLKHFLKKHKKTLPAQVVKQIRDLMDRIEYAIRHSKKAYHLLNRYHNKVEYEARLAVDKYIALLKGNKKILTAIELLDIKEFSKSRFQNGRNSMFARGMLSSKLMESLNWNGYHFIQVDPAYTSQVCPNCFNLDKKNRNGKNFVCTCCGFSDDADHVGSVNIKSRATDEEISTVCEKNTYNKEARHAGIRAVFSARHEAWRKAHPNEICPKQEEAETRFLNELIFCEQIMSKL